MGHYLLFTFGVQRVSLLGVAYMRLSAVVYGGSVATPTLCYVNL